MGVVIRRWVWLECIGVASGVVVRRYIDFFISHPYSTCIIFLAAASLLLCSC